MILETISEHTVAVDLLTGGPVLDAGARGFVFSKWFADRGHFVLALDPSPELTLEPYKNIVFQKKALVGPNVKFPYLVMTEDPGASYIAENFPAYAVEPVRMDELGFPEKIDSGWDVIKLDIEGSEYDVLMTWPGPIANQITVEFHEHTARKRGDKAIQDIVDHLSQWYKPVQHEKTQAQCAGWNYWDSLFVLKSLCA